MSSTASGHSASASREIANIAGADLGSVARQVAQALKDLGPPPPKVNVTVRGQVVPMQQMLDGLRTGLLLAVVVIFVLLAANFEFEPKLADVRLDMEASIKPDATGNYPLPKPGFTNYLST